MNQSEGCRRAQPQVAEMSATEATRLKPPPLASCTSTDIDAFGRSRLTETCEELDVLKADKAVILRIGAKTMYTGDQRTELEASGSEQESDHEESVFDDEYLVRYSEKLIMLRPCSWKASRRRWSEGA